MLAYVFPSCMLMVAIAQGQGNGWTLASGDTEVRLEISDGALQVMRLGVVGDAQNWISEGAVVPFMGRVGTPDGRERSTHWMFQKGAWDESSGTLTLTFENAEPKMLLRSIWCAKPGPGPIEHRVEIENLSGMTLTVFHQDSLTLSSISAGAEANVKWIKRGGGNASTQGGTFLEPVTSKLDLSLKSNCDDGASPCPWLAVEVGDERGLYVGWEFSGPGRVEAKGKASGGGAAPCLDIAVGNHPDFKTDIAAGEVFLVPPAFAGCYTGDIDEGAYRLHQWFLRYLRPPLPDDIADPTLAYNLYLDAGGPSATEADVLRSAEFCRDLEFETFMPDAMWFPACGDWRWDPARFPNGVKPIEEYVHKSGMRMALWCAWTNGGVSNDPAALSVRGPVGRPDWFEGDYPADWQPGPFYGGRVCLACPEAREWEIKKTQWLVENHKLDYLKHDCGPIATQCNKTTHRHKYGVDAGYWATMGYYEVQEKLRKAFPRLILENCSGGGHIKDFGIMRRTHYVVTTDTLSNLPDRQSIYDSTFAFPPLVLQAYTYERYYKVPGDEPEAFLWRSAMMGAWQIDPTNTRIWTGDERECARRHARIYKEWVRPILKDVKVHHILPRPDGKHWDGMFYWSPGLDRGTLYIFRPDAKEDEKTVPVKGLESGKNYWVWSEDGSVAVVERTGAELMGAGLSIALPQRYSSDLVYVQSSLQGRPAGLDVPGAFRLKEAETQSDPFSASARLEWEPSVNARSYRVTVSTSGTEKKVLLDRLVSGTSFRATTLPPYQHLVWNVEAISYGGKKKNEGGPAAFSTPKKTPLAGVSFVSDLPWVSSTAGADNEVHRDTNYSGNAIGIAGKKYPKGIWTHSFNDAAPADLVLDVTGKRFGSFVADVGVEDSAGNGSVVFQVLIDGVVKAESPVMHSGTVHTFHVDASGAREVTLRVLNGGDGYACDHAAWGLARFVDQGASDPVER